MGNSVEFGIIAANEEGGSCEEGRAWTFAILRKLNLKPKMDGFNGSIEGSINKVGEFFDLVTARVCSLQSGGRF